MAKWDRSAASRIAAPLTAIALASACATQDADPSTSVSSHSDRFAIAGDACGASDYAHLIGEEFAAPMRASLPVDANVVRRSAPITLEYEPGTLNVVLDGAGRIVAIGCF